MKIASDVPLLDDVKAVARRFEGEELKERVAGLILSRSDLSVTTARWRADKLLSWYRWVVVQAVESEPAETVNPVQLPLFESSSLEGQPSLGPVAAVLTDVTSIRGRQRRVALAIAELAQSPSIPIEKLRSACQSLCAFNRPNFTQNMRKDGRLFSEVRDPRAKRLIGWDLTEEGAKQALELKRELAASTE